VIREPGFVTTDHVLPVPLIHGDPDSPTIDVFAREFIAADKRDADLPWLLFLQGGPGGKGPRLEDAKDWRPALERYHVLMLDQRGVARSTPLGKPDTAGRTGEQVADYLQRFRADSIVTDAELFRRHLIGDQQWDTLGQSYGGFITMTYLSQHPEGVRRSFVTGGLPGVHASAEDVYTRTFPRIIERNAQYYRRYPQDAMLVRKLADHLRDNDVRLPDGDRLTVRRLQVLGNPFGMSYGFERQHWLLDQLRPDGTPSNEFLYNVMLGTGFVDGPLWALQEYCYAAPGAATGWAAQRERDSRPEFAEDADPLLFTGETMFPWMFREIRSLQPWAEAAEVMAAKTDWPALYDIERLRGNEVPVIAAIYYEDMYVDAELQLQTAREVPNVRAWVTNEHEHDGLRAGVVFRRMLDMADGLA
jgi:pimeloyl-ACP methyl ester carboxylesterase